MRIYLLVVLAIMLFAVHEVKANEGFYLELGAGKNGLNQAYWLGREDIGCFAGAGYAKDFGQWTIDLAYRHASQCNRGQGYDDRGETNNDSAGIYARYFFGQ